MKFPMKLKTPVLIIFAAVVFIIGCDTSNQSIPSSMSIYDKKDTVSPVAKQQPKELTIHGDTRVDKYYWMNERDHEDVVSYLNEENAYTESMLGHTKDFQTQLFEEIKGRIKQTDMSVPYKHNGYIYFTKFEEGKEYAIHVRKKSEAAKEEIMLDENELAKGLEFYSMGSTVVSPDNKMVAYGEDTLSRRIYTVKFKNLETGELLADELPGTTGYVAWANDNKTVFYTRKDETTLRSFKIMKHVLGTPVEQDEMVFEESDDTFSCFVYRSKSGDYIIIGSSHTVMNEYWYLSTENPGGKFKVIQPRERGLEYSIDHYGDKFYIHTNLDAMNFRLVTAPVSNPGKANWKELIPHRNDVYLEDIEIFKDYLVLNERIKGITELRVIPKEGKEYYIELPDASHLIYSSVNMDFDTDVLRFGYTSMTTPNSVYDFNMKSKERELLKQQEVISDTFKPENYVSERLFATAKDGTQIPISLVYKKGFKKDGSGNLLLYGYGSYGSSMDPYFSSVRLTLLDRGFAFAIAHIRGGEEMGRKWYEDGKMLNKKNTFTDFIDCGEYLVQEKYTSNDHLFAMGGSAGGLLMGAIINMRPDLWKGVVAAVPFVDVVTTMLDESIPLTTGEFDEWGNPKNEEYYHYIKSYSPYDNVEAKEYPSMLVTTGYHDSQVQYFEPAKWVAKLRELKTGDNPLLFHCNMDAGHGGASGRFRRYKETAMEYAFLFDLVGIKE